MKKVVIFLVLFFSAAVLMAQNRTYPPYDPLVMPSGVMTWNEFWGTSENRIRSNFQMAAGFNLSNFHEIQNWDAEDTQMVNWIHDNVVLQGTSTNRDVGYTWEIYVPRFQNDGWLILTLWHPPVDGGGWYQYRLFYLSY